MLRCSNLQKEVRKGRERIEKKRGGEHTGDSKTQDLAFLAKASRTESGTLGKQSDTHQVEKQALECQVAPIKKKKKERINQEQKE